MTTRKGNKRMGRILYLWLFWMLAVSDRVGCGRLGYCYFARAAVCGVLIASCKICLDGHPSVTKVYSRKVCWQRLTRRKIMFLATSDIHGHHNAANGFHYCCSTEHSRSTMGRCYRRRGVRARTDREERADIFALGCHQVGDDRRAAIVRQLRRRSRTRGEQNRLSFD